MSQDTFWQIIETSLRDDPDEQCEALEAELRELKDADILSFLTDYNAALDNAYSWDLWGAAYVINGGSSDDGFDYFRDWLIAQGKTVYDRALTDPSSLIGIAEPFDTEFENFRYVPYDILDERGVSPPQRSMPEKEPTGESWEEEGIEARFPKLAAWINSSSSLSDLTSPPATKAPPPWWSRLFGRR